MSIQQYLDKIKNAVYGREVRGAIHDAIKQTYDDAAEGGDANMEVKMARGTEPTLGDRLDKQDELISENLEQTEKELAKKATKNELNIALDTKVGKGENESITWAMASQDFKEQITGGNTAVVGENSVNTSNLIDGSATSVKRTPLGELCFIVTGETSPYPDFRPDEGRIVIDGAINIFHRNERYFINEPFVIDFKEKADQSGTVAIYYNTSTGLFNSYMGWSMDGISENEILFAVYGLESGEYNLVMNGVYTVNGSLATVTSKKRTTIGELPFITIGQSGGTINLNSVKGKVEFLGTAFVFHRNKRYSIPVGTEVDFSYINSAAYVLYLNIDTNSVYIREQTGLSNITENSIMLGVINKSSDKWHFQINTTHYTIDGKSPHEIEHAEENKSYTYTVESLVGDFPESDFEGVGDTGSPFDGNETHELIYGLFDDIVTNNFNVTRSEYGQSTNGIPLYVYKSEPTRAPIVEGPQLKPYPEITIISSIHGGESLSTYSLYYFFKRVVEDWKENSILGWLRNYVKLSIIPLPNPEDFDTKSYIGIDGINLNRDFGYNHNPNAEGAGPEPFTRIESRALRDYLLANKDSMLFVDCHVRGGAVPNDDMMMWLGTSELRETRFSSTTIEKLSNKWKVKYPSLENTDGTLGYISTREGQGVVKSYVQHVVGIPSILWEGFKGSPSFTNHENKDVVNLNVQFLGETIVNALKNQQKI